MTQNELRRRDVACLGRLINGPLEIGAIPEETVERLTDRGLVVQVLGCCEITGSGQLSYHRQQFPGTPRTGRVSATRNDPLYQRSVPQGTRLLSTRLRRIFAMRHKIDARLRQAREFPHWLKRLASQRAGHLRSIQENNAIPEDGHSQNDNETE